ncbi:hypothetical protein JCM14036_26630 [Desulfotomaculum defluvii]
MVKIKTFVIYDIEEDKIRNKVLEVCRDYGLAHVQYSTFFGELNHNRREEMKLRLKRILGRKNGKILVFPVCDKDLRLLENICNMPELAPHA